jgi:hypothetical protein
VRIKRRLFNLAAAVSLAVCAAACALWVRSALLGHADHVYRYSADAAHSVLSARGRLFAQRFVTRPPWWDAGRWEYQYWTGGPGRYDEPMELDVLGLGFDRGHGTSTRTGLPYTVTRVVLPLWAVSLAAAVLPAAWLARRVRGRRRRPGERLCSACGYDLRATPERCPECGAVAPSARKAA